MTGCPDKPSGFGRVYREDIMEVANEYCICQFPDGNIGIVDEDDLGDWGDQPPDERPKVIGKLSVLIAEDVTDAERQAVIKFGNTIWEKL